MWSLTFTFYDILYSIVLAEFEKNTCMVLEYVNAFIANSTNAHVGLFMFQSRRLLCIDQCMFIQRPVAS